MLGFLFPGQGSQYVGMGSDLFREYPSARKLFLEANEILGFPLTQLMFDGMEEKLDDTRNAQPAIVAHSVAIACILQERGILPQMVAGHSVGEYSAAVAAGALDPHEALRLVWKRGALMAEAAAQVGGVMAAILGLPASEVEPLVAQAAQEGVCVVANYNTPLQLVISGETAAVERAMELARGAGAKRAMLLRVSGAFHSPLMQPAAEQMQPLLSEARFAEAAVPLVSNVDATPRTEAEGIRRALAAQITGQVRWEESIRRMLESGVDSFVEVGPGQVLAKMVRQIEPGAHVHSACDAESMLVTVTHLGAEA